MTIRLSLLKIALYAGLMSASCIGTPVASAATAPNEGVVISNLPTMQVQELTSHLKVGDVVFIRVSAKPFREVSTATGSWTNHVGVVIAFNKSDPVIGESTFPFSRTTTLTQFLARSEQGRVAVSRLKRELRPEQSQLVLAVAKRHIGILYDTGFNLHSKREFCSRFVREVLGEATGADIGEVETFKALLLQRPETDLSFWKLWYFGRIPWERQTVTPASLLRSPELRPVFDGVAMNDRSNSK